MLTGSAIWCLFQEVDTSAAFYNAVNKKKRTPARRTDPQSPARQKSADTGDAEETVSIFLVFILVTRFIYKNDIKVPSIDGRPAKIAVLRYIYTANFVCTEKAAVLLNVVESELVPIFLVSDTDND